MTTHPAKYPGDASGGRSKVGLHLVLHAIRNWWILATPPGIILGALAALGVWLAFEPVYRATALVEIKAQEHVAFASTDDIPRFVRTQVQLIRSPLVLNAVVSDPTIAQLPELAHEDDPVEWLNRHLVVESIGASDLFDIRVEAPSADNATKIVNAVLDAYLKIRHSDVDDRTMRLISILEDELSSRKHVLNELREKVRRMTKEASKADTLVTGPDGDTTTESAVISGLTDLRKQLILTEFDHSMMEGQLRNVQQELESDAQQTFSDAEIDAHLRGHAEVVAQQELIDDARARIKQLKKIVRDNQKLAPLELAERELKDHLKELEDVRATIRPKIAQELAARAKDERQQEIEELKSKIKNDELLEETIKRKLESYRIELADAGNDTLDLEFARDELSRAEEVHEKIANRIEQLRTEIKAPDRVSLLDRATIPKKPVQYIPYRNLVGAGVSGFCFPFILALLWEARIRRIADPEQVTHETNLTMLGEITTLPVKSLMAAGSRSRRFELDRDTFEESIDYLRTSLLLSHTVDTVQVIAVASATSSEGKSSLASHLAVSLARASGEPVLLIDADMRDPDVHRMFGIAGTPGLAEVLQSRCQLSDAIVTSTGGNLHFLPAGRLGMSPHVLLGEGRFVALLERLRPSYRHIVVDAPPVLPAGDALIIAQAADGTLMCTMRDVSRGPQVRLACERLQRAGARLLGAVLSGVPAQTYVQRYGSYRYAYPRFRDGDTVSDTADVAQASDSVLPARETLG